MGPSSGILAGWIWSRKRSVFLSMVAAVVIVSLLISSSITLAADSDIESLLEGKSSAERANIKASEIVRKNPEGVYQDPTYGLKIEVQSI